MTYYCNILLSTCDEKYFVHVLVSLQRSQHVLNFTMCDTVIYSNGLAGLSIQRYLWL